MKNKGFLLALLENFSIDKIDVMPSNSIMEGVKPAFGSPGGKFFVAGKLINMFPEHKRYVEAFIGGGSILFRKKKEAEEFINDKDNEIYACYKFMQGITPEQIESLNKCDWKTSETTFNKLLAEYKESPMNKDPVYQFYRYTYIKAASDAGEMRSYDGRAEGEVMKLTTRLAKIKERLAGVTIENMDYIDFVNKYSNAESFTFLDPPYPSAKMNWKWCPTQEEFESFTKKIPGKWMITYEVCDGWKEKQFERKILSQYNLAAPSAGHMARKSELIISNYPLKEYNLYVSESIELEDAEDLADFMDKVDISRLAESTGSKEELNDILKLYTAKRRGDDVKQSFEQLKTSFRSCMSKMIESGINDFNPDKIPPFALELFDKYTTYGYSVPQTNGAIQEFKTLKDLKASNIDYRGYKFHIEMKESEKKIGNFVCFKQWWKGRAAESKPIETFMVTTDLCIDLYLDKNTLSESIPGTFYIKPSKDIAISLTEGIHYIKPGSELNITSMPSWIKKISEGKISITESTELEKILEFSIDGVNNTFIATRNSESSDFWSIIKKT
jgi:DNA adenine methylase